MGNDYIDKANQVLMERPEWPDRARQFESSLAAKLATDQRVLAAAVDALVRLRQRLAGIDGPGAALPEPEEKAQELTDSLKKMVVDLDASAGQGEEQSGEEDEDDGMLRNLLKPVAKQNQPLNKQGRSFVKKSAAKGFVVNAGPSEASARALKVYRKLGAGEQELLWLRLALASWLIPKGSSLYEVIAGAREAGVRGEEDDSSALMLYQTLGPLNQSELRAAAVDRQFPHEHVYMTMLVAPFIDNDKNPKRGHENAPRSALNVYAAPIYTMMNTGMRRGSAASERVQRNSGGRFNDARLALAYGASSVMAHSMPYMKKERGRVYRGTETAAAFLNYGKRGKVMSGKAFTSTSRKMGISMQFYKPRAGLAGKIMRPILIEIELNGHGGVDISNIGSTQAFGKEVLLMPGTQLRVEEPLKSLAAGEVNPNYQDGVKVDKPGGGKQEIDRINFVKMKEVGNPYNKYTGDSDNDGYVDPLRAGVEDLQPEPLSEAPELTKLLEQPNTPETGWDDMETDGNDDIDVINMDMDDAHGSGDNSRLDEARQWLRSQKEALAVAEELPGGGDFSDNRLADSILYVLVNELRQGVFFSGNLMPGMKSMMERFAKDALKTAITKDKYINAVKAAYDSEKKPSFS